MHQQTIIVLLLGLAVSTYGLDLSHAKRSAAVEPRAAKVFADLYAQTILPPLQDIVTKLVGLIAKIVASVSQMGFLSADGRRVHPSDEQLRGFFSGLWNEAIKPPLENTIQNVALLAAQLLAGIGSNGVNLGIGKRDMTEEEMRGFFSGLWNEAIKPPLENTIQNVALLAAQLLAGIGSNGVNLGIGKRDMTEEEMRGFLDSLTQAVNDVYTNVLQKPIENALSSGALMLAQVLAGLGTNGVNLSGLLGKRDLSEEEMRGFLDSLNQAVNDVYTNVLQKPLENALSSGALMLAQVLAGLGTNGVNLSGLLGKRDLSQEEMRGFLDSLNQAVNDVYTNVLQKPIENALSSGALMLAQVLAGLGTNGVNLSGLFGKRDLSEEEMRGFLDSLNQAVNDVYTNVLQKPLENALSSGALMLAQVLAGLGTNGVNLSGLLGKRDLSQEEMRGFLDSLNQAVNDVYTNVLQKPIENALSSGALMLAQVLAGLGTNGVNLSGLFGKRDLSQEEMRGFLDSLNQAVNDVYTNVLQKPIENALSSGALMLAQVLAGLGTNGVNLSGLFGKRDLTEEEMRGLLGTITSAIGNGVAGVWNGIFQVPLENFVQNTALTAAGWLANIATEGVNLG